MQTQDSHRNEKDVLSQMILTETGPKDPVD